MLKIYSEEFQPWIIFQQDGAPPHRVHKFLGFTKITEDLMGNTWREIDYRLDVLRATKGAHVEVY
jgi:hypothetical protein